MGMVVRTNTMSTNAYRQLGMNSSSVSKSLEKLSSGFRINRAGDDASGLAISEKMKAQINGLEQASSNSQDGISLIQTAEGATTEIHSMLNRMVTLATKSANGTNQDDVDRDAIQEEVDALKSEISRIADSTNFNGIDLLNGSLAGASGKEVDLNGMTIKGLDDSITSVKVTFAAGSSNADASCSAAVSSNVLTITVNGEDGTGTALTEDAFKTALKSHAADSAAGVTIDNFAAPGADVAAASTTASSSGLQLQVGDTDDTFNHVIVNVDNLSAEGLGIKDLDVSTQEAAENSIQTIKDAINKVSTNRGNLGALQNRLEHTINNLDTTNENMQAANSRIRDTDMAKEMMNYTKMNILTQSAQSMLAQANQQPQSILQLLQ